MSWVAQNDGHTVCNTLQDDPEVIICIDYHKRFRSLLNDGKQLGIPCVLVKQEPIVVYPQHIEANPDSLLI